MSHPINRSGDAKSNIVDRQVDFDPRRIPNIGTICRSNLS